MTICEQLNLHLADLTTMERANLLINNKQLEITTFIESTKMCNPTPGETI